MTQFTFIVEQTIDGFSAYYKFPEGGIIATRGDTWLELKKNALEATNLTLDYNGKPQIIIDDITFK